jgi:hypothetical protein
MGNQRQISRTAYVRIYLHLPDAQCRLRPSLFGQYFKILFVHRPSPALRGTVVPLPSTFFSELRTIHSELLFTYPLPCSVTLFLSGILLLLGLTSSPPRTKSVEPPLLARELATSPSPCSAALSPSGIHPWTGLVTHGPGRGCGSRLSFRRSRTPRGYGP